MKIKGVEIKPGMVIKTNVNGKEELWVVFPTKDSLGIICNNKCAWDSISHFIKCYSNNITKIYREPIDYYLTSGGILWEKKKIKKVLTKKDIADMLGISLEDYEIVVEE